MRTIQRSSDLIPAILHVQVLPKWPFLPPRNADAEALCLVMPLVRCTLGALVNAWRAQTRQTACPERFVLWVLVQLLQALAHLQKHNVAHGALGPGSVAVELYQSTRLDPNAPLGAFVEALDAEPFTLQFRLKDFGHASEMVSSTASHVRCFRCMSGPQA